MKLISRFTSNEALEFEFELPEDGLQNRQTLFVSQVAITLPPPRQPQAMCRYTFPMTRARIKSGIASDK